MGVEEVQHAGASFIRSIFGPTTSHAVFLTSLPNNKDDPNEAPRQVVTRDIADITRFCMKWDRPERGLFYCVGTLKPGQTRRAKANVSEIIGLHADVDLKSIMTDADGALQAIDRLLLRPSIVNRSGNGFHPYWFFREAIPATPENIERVEAALRLLADLVGGDLSVCEISRLMRLPGTHNTKNGAWIEVQTIREHASARYELDELEEWLCQISPVIHRKEVVGRSSSPSVARSEIDGNPFLAVAARFGFKPPIDVERRLAAMSYQGAGDSAVHPTQLQVSASLLSRGSPIEEVVDIISAATRAAAGPYGARWNWKREDREIRKMCEDWVRKNPTVAALTPAKMREEAVNGQGSKAEKSIDDRSNPGQPRPLNQVKALEEVINGGAVVQLSEARAKKEKPNRKPATDKQGLPGIVADGVVEAVQRVGQDILLTEGEIWLYADGIWHVMTEADRQWLLTLIQKGFEVLGEVAKNANLTAAWKRLTEHPLLFHRKVAWAGADAIICQNGVLDIATRELKPHSPLHYARRKIGVPYQPGAKCPQFEQLLRAMFSDRPVNDQGGFTGTIQSWVGSALAIKHLSREERKALLLVGPSRTGKTELSRIIRLLIGDPIATPSIAEISERFGLSSLYEAAAWIRDDAINEGDDLDPQRFKTIVTGEPIDIERKYRPAIAGVELSLPVLLTTNALPRAKDKSDAIFNRSIVLEMTNVVSEADAHKMRSAINVARGSTIGSHIFASEGPGILNWALDGLRTLLERGSYDLPASVRLAVQRFKDDNNPVGEWSRVAITRSPSSKVARADLMCAYHGWQREQDGDEARAFGGRAFFPRLRSAAPWSGEIGDSHGRRYITGIALTDEGLQLWEAHNLGPQLKGGAKGSSQSKSEVNKAHSETPKTEEKNDEFQAQNGGGNDPLF